jgi:hypothetical protein
MQPIEERKRLYGKNRRPMNGDFSDYEVRCMVASYCRDITIGMAGWGVPFTVWVELKGLAKFEKGSLYKLDKPTCECEMCDGRRAAHEELESSFGTIIDKRPKTDVQKAIELLEKEGLIVDGKILKQ